MFLSFQVPRNATGPESMVGASTENYLEIQNAEAVQWWRVCTFTLEGPGSIPGQEPKIPQSQAAQPKINTLNRDIDK